MNINKILVSLSRKPINNPFTSLFGLTTKTEPVKVGCFKLSIQASSGHYCEPKEDLDSFDEYKSYERKEHCTRYQSK